MKNKLFILGLDCATPQFLFDQHLESLPNFKKLFTEGTHGPLRSTTPAITVPAWMSMMTSQTPGDLGVYGFRNRVPGSDYDDMWIATAQKIKYKKVWNYLNEVGLKTGMLGVPQTFPVKEVDGFMVSSFLTPGLESNYTYPQELRDEIEEVVGEYIFDYANRSTEPPAKVLEAIYTMTRKRFKLVKHFIKNKQWDFLMMVEMGTDRIHHYMWSYIDEKHPKYHGDNEFKNSVRDYYKYIDQELGEIMKILPPEAGIMVVSDHGAKAMQGMFLINEWLIKEGYLVLKEYPKEVTSLTKDIIDWSKTKAWAWGGFYSRIFVNVKGREPQGIVEDFEAVKKELMDKLREVKDDQGDELDNLIITPDELYDDPQGDPPDIFAFFGDLAWRPGGTVGHQNIYIHENDTGPDDGVHDWYGVYSMWKPNQQGSGKQEGLNILDIAPTILDYFGVNIPENFKGKIINY